MTLIKACLFDLDGVIVDTAKYHYIAWKELADKLGFSFTEQHNELLKGISRMRSLEILLEIGRIKKNEDEKMALAYEKNERYIACIRKMTPGEILPGARQFLQALREKGILTALGSASKNAPIILEQTGILHLFDAVVDGNQVSKAKPDPEVFLKGAEQLQVCPSECVVFEDAIAGIEAAKNAGMQCVGIGDARILGKADLIIPGFTDFTVEKLFAHFVKAREV
ncbi:MAG: beta-phosphoglucomutase [Prolixibacteraceae bacterium]|jgi:beta-phosphoglucomutase|nr:beta-phosphoglucomutase [Prolixibacteraceae bacterium]